MVLTNIGERTQPRLPAPKTPIADSALDRTDRFSSTRSTKSLLLPWSETLHFANLGFTMGWDRKFPRARVWPGSRSGPAEASET